MKAMTEQVWFFLRPTQTTMALGVVFLAMLAALFSVTGVNPFRRRMRITRLTKVMIQSKRDRILGRQLNLWDRFLIRVESMLKRMDKTMRFFYMLLAGAFLAGLALGSVIFDDVFLAVCMGVCCLPMPYLYLLVRISWYQLTEEEMIKSAMDIITNTYLGTDDIQTAFEHYVQSEIRYGGKSSVFSHFLSEVMFVDPSIDRGLLVMAEKIHNPYFSQWVKMLIMCHSDRRLKFSLRPIIDSMTDAKYIQMEHETVMMATWREYLTTLILMFSVLPLFRVSNHDWFMILTETFIGRALMALMLVVAAGSAFLILWINQPVNEKLYRKMKRGVPR
jgi:hypothetical protein